MLVFSRRGSFLEDYGNKAIGVIEMGGKPTLPVCIVRFPQYHLSCEPSRNTSWPPVVGPASRNILPEPLSYESRLV